MVGSSSIRSKLGAQAGRAQSIPSFNIDDEIPLKGEEHNDSKTREYFPNFLLFYYGFIKKI